MCNYFFSYITANLNCYCIKVKKIFKKNFPTPPPHKNPTPISPKNRDNAKNTSPCLQNVIAMTDQLPLSVLYSPIVMVSGIP